MLSDQIRIRESDERDVSAIRELFQAAYGEDYAFPHFFELSFLKKQVYSDECLMLVAEDCESGQILGTGSVVLEVGAYTDLVGEFGRLVVHPSGRGRGIANRLMQERLTRVADHLHVGLADNRVEHPYSQKVSQRHGFAPVGYLPIHNGEPVALFARYFNDSLSLRRNHPHIAGSLYWIADAAMQSIGLPCDVVVDDSSVSYPSREDFELEEMTAQGYSRLLRFERGRLRHRDIFGPVKLHFGSRALRRHNTHYLLAKRGGQLMGAVGYSRDPNIDNAVRIFELIYLNEQPVRFLLSHLERRCRETWGVDYVETEVSADAPRMQKTLLELGFLPVAYVPAGVFHNVERLDTVRMARYYVPLSDSGISLIDSVQPIAEGVIEQFRQQWIEPVIADMLPRTSVFKGLSAEQTTCLANVFRRVQFRGGQWIVKEGSSDDKVYILLSGHAAFVGGGNGDPTCFRDRLGPGEFVGELSLLHHTSHSGYVKALESVDAAVADVHQLNRLLRDRSDIASVLYRNLAMGLGAKLRRASSVTSARA